MKSQVLFYTTIVLPVAPQPDTLAAIFILKRFGDEHYPGISSAGIETWQMLPENTTNEAWEEKGYILIDIGGGKFDHHLERDKTSVARLVADDLGITDDPALTKLLEYARRDDMFGKGTVSDDPLDRAFGLSGLINNLNRSHVGNPEIVASVILPLFDAHYNEEYRRTKELPQEFEHRKNNGAVSIHEIKQRGKKLKVILIESDNTGMAGFLRSQNGGKFDVVVQHMSTGYVNILTRPTKRVDLRALAALIRIREVESQNLDLDETAVSLMRTARHPKIKEWYYDRATNSIQNGGLNPKEIPPTQIPWTEFPKIVELGLAETIINPLTS